MTTAFEPWAAIWPTSEPFPPGDFEEFLRVERCRRASEYIGRLGDLLARYGEKPDYWANDVREASAAVRSAVVDPVRGVPFDLLGSRSLDEARTLTQRLVRRFGDLMQVWPDMMGAARRLRSRGHRLAQPVERRG